MCNPRSWDKKTVKSRVQGHSQLQRPAPSAWDLVLKIQKTKSVKNPLSSIMDMLIFVNKALDGWIRYIWGINTESSKHLWNETGKATLGQGEERYGSIWLYWRMWSSQGLQTSGSQVVRYSKVTELGVYWRLSMFQDLFTYYPPPSLWQSPELDYLTDEETDLTKEEYLLRSHAELNMNPGLPISLRFLSRTYEANGLSKCYEVISVDCSFPSEGTAVSVLSLRVAILEATTPVSNIRNARHRTDLLLLVEDTF